MTKCKFSGLVSTLILSCLSLQAGAVNIPPTCEIDDGAKTISLTDGYQDYLDNLAGSDLEYIGPAIDEDNWNYLNGRSYDIDHLPTVLADESNRSQVIQAWQVRDDLYEYPQDKTLMIAEILSKSELRDITELEADGLPIPARVKVFSEPVHFEAEVIDGPDDWRNNHIPLSVYKFWGLLVPQETGTFKIRFQKDDGLIVHIDLGSGMEAIVNKFEPISDFNNTGDRIVVARHGGNDVFDFSVANVAYPIHIQWLNYDGPHALQMEYSPSNAEDWKVIPKEWFNPGADPRGIVSITLENELSPSYLNPDISNVLSKFTPGDIEVEGQYDFDDDTQGGLHSVLVKNEAGFETTCDIKVPTVEQPMVVKALVKKISDPNYSNSVTILLGETVSFKGSDTESFDADLTVNAYDWELDDGSLNKSSADFDYTYSKAGTYDITLTATDDIGSDSKKVKVIVQDPPVAKAVFSDEDETVRDITITLGESVNFDGSLSTDSDGEIKSYSWDFGDGSSGDGAITSHEYTEEKDEYTITLLVTDADGLTSTDTINVTVQKLNLPTAVIKVFTADGSELELVSKVNSDTKEEQQGFVVNQFEEVLIEGLDSFDDDGVVIGYLWNGLGDAAIYSNNSKQTFTEKGFKEVSLTVTDNDNLSHTLDVIIWVNEAPYVDIGEIDISYNGEEGISGEARGNFEVDGDRIIIKQGNAILLDASGSFDDGIIAKYTWCPTAYFNEKSKVCEAPESAENLVGHSAKYEYTANQQPDERMTLIVEDEHGASSAATFEIVKYDSKYQANGSMGMGIFSLLSSFIWWRRRDRSLKA